MIAEWLDDESEPPEARPTPRGLPRARVWDRELVHDCREWFCRACGGVIPANTLHWVERSTSANGVTTVDRTHRERRECRQWPEETGIEIPSVFVAIAIFILVFGALALWNIAR